MVEWIEISIQENPTAGVKVSTLVVEWIEIDYIIPMAFGIKVSTLVVEWIEITSMDKQIATAYGLHPRGGVD